MNKGKYVYEGGRGSVKEEEGVRGRGGAYERGREPSERRKEREYNRQNRDNGITEKTRERRVEQKRFSWSLFKVSEQSNRLHFG